MLRIFSSNRFLVFVLGLPMLWATALALDVWPLLRGGWGWRYPYALPDAAWRVAPFLVGLVIFGGVAHWLRSRPSGWPLVAWTVVAGSGLIVAALFISAPDVQFELYTRTLSSSVTGWHFMAADMDDQGVDAMLSTWPQQMETYHYFSAHLALSPPGLVLGYHGANEALSAMPSLADTIGRPLRADQCHDYRFMSYTNAELSSAWLGILTPLWTMLAAVPLYALGRRFYSEDAARWAVIWWGLLPAALIFQPYPSTVYPLLAVPVMLALVQGLVTDGRGWVLGAGLLMGLLSFTTFSTLPLLLMAGVVALLVFGARRRTADLAWHWPVQQGLWFGVGLAALWGVYYAAYGVPVWDMLQQTFDTHLELERPYLPWIFLHLYEFMIFMGLPVALLAGAGVWQSARQVWQDGLARPSMGMLVSLGLGITLLVVDLSGTARGETGRVWMFLMPFGLLAAAHTLTERYPERGWWVTGGQALVVLAIALVLRPIGTGLTPPPSVPSLNAQPATSYLSNGAVFGDTIVLREYAGHIEVAPQAANDEDEETAPYQLVTWLRWESQGQVDMPYYIGLLPVVPDGTPLTATLAQPFDGDFPMTCWLPERGLIEDRYVVPLDREAVQGDWWLSVGILDREGRQLPVVYPDGTRDQQVGIGPFRLLETATR